MSIARGAVTCRTTDACQLFQSSKGNQDSSQEEKNVKHTSARRLKTIPKPWRLTHGFYAQMGGFVLDTTGAFPGVIPPDRSVLTSNSFRYLFKRFEESGIASYRQNSIRRDAEESPLHIARTSAELTARDNENDMSSPNAITFTDEAGDGIDLSPIINTSEEDIKDKSKASGLAKTLVCVQALWFCAQCISRVAENLPITLLELNTFAHALCTLLVYLLWWNKPLVVDRATTIPIRDEKSIGIWADIHPKSQHLSFKRLLPQKYSDWLDEELRPFIMLIPDSAADEVVLPK